MLLLVVRSAQNLICHSVICVTSCMIVSLMYSLKVTVVLIMLFLIFYLNQFFCIFCNSYNIIVLCMQLWASEVGSNYELVYIVTIIPAIYVISCKITVLGFIFLFLYQKLSLFTGTIYSTHILFHLNFHNSFKHSHFIHSSQCFQYLFSSLQFMTTATFGTSPFTYCFPNHSDHFSPVLAYATYGSPKKLRVRIKSSYTENFIYVFCMCFCLVILLVSVEHTSVCAVWLKFSLL